MKKKAPHKTKRGTRAIVKRAIEILQRGALPEVKVEPEQQQEQPRPISNRDRMRARLAPTPTKKDAG